jgi:NAD(P)-dependent dehydrogenase (short-subunit alcohol dehydrogenase family)
MSTNPVPLTVLVVGATSGLGRAVATQLADAGHRVLAVGRDPNHATTLTTALQERSGADPAVLIADVSTRQGWHDVSSWTEQNATRLDGIVHNAGVMLPTRHTTSDGYETNFAVHHRAPFALTSRLLPLLRQGAVPDGPGGRALPRVINVNSAGHQASLGGHSNPTLDFADLQAERDYNPFLVYSRTKLANLLFSSSSPAATATSSPSPHCTPGWSRATSAASSPGSASQRSKPSAPHPAKRPLPSPDSSLGRWHTMASTTTGQPLPGPRHRHTTHKPPPSYGKPPKSADRSPMRRHLRASGTRSGREARHDPLPAGCGSRVSRKTRPVHLSRIGTSYGRARAP